MSRPNRVLFTCALAAALAACGKPPAPEGAKPSKAAPALLVAAVDLVKVQSDTIAQGPLVSGSIQPERRADLRAEISSVVQQVLKDNGERVRRGDLLVRLDDTTVRDNLASAQEGARVAQQALDAAERNLQRLQSLRASGMAAAQQIEDAEVRRNGAQGDLAAARAREVQARQQMQQTRISAPYDGVVSERKVSPGDTVSVGRELIKVYDPASMRFEGTMAADQATQVKPGQAVNFQVSGQPGMVFQGTVRRVNPSANAATRQIEVLVDFAAGKRPELSGLYAEGSIAAVQTRALTLPAGVIVNEGDKNYVWRAKDGVMRKVAVTLGLRDPRRGDYAVNAGLAEGDLVLRHPSSTLKDGQSFQMAQAPQPGASAPASAPQAAVSAASAAR